MTFLYLLPPFSLFVVFLLVWQVEPVPVTELASRGIWRGCRDSVEPIPIVVFASSSMLIINVVVGTFWVYIIISRVKYKI